MVKVANDAGRRDGDLPAADRPSSRSRSDSDVSGISLRLIAGLAAAAQGSVHGSAHRLEATVDSTLPLGRALERAGTVEHRSPTDAARPLAHCLVLADADALRAAADGEAESATTLVAPLHQAGAAALVASGLDPAAYRSLADAAERAGLPLIEVPPGHVATFTTEVLSAILDHQTAMLRRLEDADRALVQIVLGGGSLDALCEQVVGFLDGAAMVTTSDGRVIARAGSSQELAHAEALDCFDRTGRLLTESEPMAHARDERSGASRASGRAAVRIVAGHLDHGVLIAFCSHRELTADDVRLLERAATVAALAITKDEAVAAVESKYRAEFLRDALAGRAGSAADAVAHAASLGWQIDRPMVVVVAETDEDDDRTSRDPDEVRFLQQRFARAWTHAMGVRDPAAPVVGFSREVVALVGVPADADAERIMRSVADLVRVVRGDGGGGRRSFSAGVSRPITSVGDLPRAYDEALSAVTVGRQMHGDGAMTHVDGLGIYRLLALIPESADLRRFVREALGELATDDSPEYAGLRETLGILLETNLNVAETARRLFFHYNTLRYRIGKLEKMLGPFSTDPDLRLTLALALKIHAMRGI